MLKIQNSKLIVAALLLSVVMVAGAAFPEQITKFAKKAESRLQVFAQIEIPLYFSPRFPDRLSFVVSELAIAGQEVEYLGSTLRSEIANCGCQNMASECFDCSPGRVLGDPCPQRRQVERDQFDLEIKTDQILFLRRLLKNEMKVSLERELATLREDDAQNIIDNFEALLQQTQAIIDSSRNVGELSQTTSETSGRCQAQCGTVGDAFGWQACVGAVGQQKPGTARFSVGVSLSDLELPDVKIENINLGLPQEITTSGLPDLSSFAVPLPPVQINFPETALGQVINLAPQPVVFRPQGSQIPRPPSFNFSCPTFPALSSSYQWPDTEQEETIELPSGPLDEWSQRFDELKQMCLAVVLHQYEGEEGSDYYSAEEYAACHNPNSVRDTIIGTCESIRTAWRVCLDLYDEQTCVPPPTECNVPPPPFNPQPPGGEIDYVGGNGEDPQLDAPPATWIWTDRGGPPFQSSRCPGIDPQTYFFSLVQGKNPNNWLQVMNEIEPNLWACGIGQQKDSAGTPRGRLFLPTAQCPDASPVTDQGRFLGVRQEPLCWTHTVDVVRSEGGVAGGSLWALEQTIGNFPKSMLDCPVSPSTVPKIRFPKIIIPDIRTPDFRVWPFIDIKLPDFIIEDLILPDLLLCDLNNCASLFPDLRFQTPALDIPEVGLPAICLPQAPIFVPGAGNVSVIMPCVGMDNIRYPIVPYVNYQLFNLGNLMTPEIDIEGISFPRPRLTFAFRGVDIDFLNLALGLLQAFLPPLPSACVSFGISGIPIRINFDDIIFRWPSFPNVPEIPFCSEINQFCRQIKLNIADVTNKVSEIENIINEVFRDQIQEELDSAAQSVNEQIATAIQEQLEERAQKIKEEIERHVQLSAKVAGGKIQVSPLSIQLDPIIIPRISLQNMVNIPATLEIPWPDELKKVLLRNAISYSLPPVPLSQLSYQEDFELQVPGFQLTSPIVSLGPLRGACQARAPSGSNPYPITQIQSALDRVQQTMNQIEQTSQNIIDILR